MPLNTAFALRLGGNWTAPVARRDDGSQGGIPRYLRGIVMVLDDVGHPGGKISREGDPAPHFAVIYSKISAFEQRIVVQALWNLRAGALQLVRNDQKRQSADVV